jgi:SAM-dependent methyltransferase
VAGCGTSQAVRHAVQRPGAHVVGIDVSETSVEHTRSLAARHGVSNLDVHRLRIEEVDRLDERFDHVVCTGVLHHLADPCLGLQRLRDVLAPGGAITLMVYARYGRTGVYMLQEYCRRLGVGTSPDDLADLVTTLREIPLGHPLSRLLRESRDFADDDALADALCNPRDRAYSVPELFDLIGDAGLRFGRWARQAPYRPDCGAVGETPHAARIATTPALEQYALMELFRGTMTRHTAIAFDADDDATSGALDFALPAAQWWVPVPVPTAIAVEERLPPGAAAALINRAHTDTDLVLFVDGRQFEIFRSIDGTRTVAELGDGAAAFVERLWRHDLVVVDATAGGDSA